MSSESTVNTRFYRLAQRLIGMGIAIVPTYLGDHRAKFIDWQNQATLRASKVDEWMNQGYPNGDALHLVTEDHNWVCVAKRGGVGCLDIDNLAKCLAMGMPALPEGCFTVDTPGGGLHVPFVHTLETGALNNKHDVYDQDDKENGELVFEFKGHNTPWCAPWQTRAKDGGYYKPRNGKAPLMVGLQADLIAWLKAHSEEPSPNHTPAEWQFDKDFDRDEFATLHEAELQGRDYYDNGTLYDPIDECPICGASSGNSTARAAKCKFIFGGRGRGGYICHACGISSLEELETALEEKDADWLKWDEPIYERPDASVSDWGLDDTPAPALAPTPAAEGTTAAIAPTETEAAVAKKITAILRSPGLSVKNPDGMTDQEKTHAICRMIFKHLKDNGKLFNCGNVATFVDNQKREIIQVTKGNPHFTRLLMRYGVDPADKATPAIGMFLGSMATTAPENTVYLMSLYNRDEHVLYVNEYAGNFLKIDSTGVVTRMRNGDDDILFTDGREGRSEPLVADLDAAKSQARLCGPLALESGPGLIKREILDTINYSEDGVGKDSAQLILLLCILALFFPERIPSMPQTFLIGQGASMKTSLAVKVGRLVHSRKFAALAATDDEQKLKDMAISLPFLVLDEANQVKKLTNVLKVIATGGIDHRRELYTTAEMRSTPYQARIWVTANNDSLTNETITARLMIIDAAARTEAEPYCSEHYLVWSEDERNAIWTELIGRLAASMRALALADAKGEGNLHVSHRMSSFFVFGRALARECGVEDQLMGAMNAMTDRQTNASAQDNKILSLINSLPESYKCSEFGATGMRTAEEWAGIFGQVVSDRNIELQREACRPGWVRFQFTSNVKLLTNLCGMVQDTILTDQKNRIKRYGFKRSEEDTSEI